MRFFLFFVFVRTLARPLDFFLYLHSFYGCVSYAEWKSRNFHFEFYANWRISLCVLCAVARMQHTIALYVYRQLRYLSSFSLLLPFFLFRFCFLFVCTTHISCICHFSGCYEYNSFIIRSFCVFFRQSATASRPAIFFVFALLRLFAICAHKTAKCDYELKSAFFSLVCTNNKQKVHFVCAMSTPHTPYTSLKSLINANNGENKRMSSCLN